MGIFRKNKRKEIKDLGRSPEQAQIIILEKHESELLLDKNYQTVAQNAFKGNPDGFTVVDMVASAIANLDYKVYKYNNKQEKEYFDTHPFLELIKRPNPDRGKFEYMYELVMFFLLSGQAFQRKIDVLKQPKQLYACRPDLIGMLLSKTKQEGWYFDYNGKKKSYEIDEISYLRIPDPTDDYLGFSPLRAAAYNIDGNNASDQWNYSMIINGAKPSGILKTDGNLTEPVLKRLKNSLRALWSGQKNAGKAQILEGGLEWQPMSLSQKDMDNINYSKLNSRKIAQVLKVPVQKVDPENQTYNNLKESDKAFYKDAVLPLSQRFVDEWNNWLMPLYGEGQLIEIDKDKIEALGEDQEVIAQRTREDYNNGIIMRSEARTARGLSVEESDNVYKVNSNDIFLDAKTGEFIIPILGFQQNTENEDIKNLLSDFLKKKENKAKVLTTSIIASALDSISPEELHEDVKDLYYTLLAEEGVRVMTEVLDLDKTFNITKAMENYVEKDGLQNATAICDTLKEKLNVQIKKGIAENEGFAEIKARLQKVFDTSYSDTSKLPYIEVVPNHLEVIARTEALTASSVATQEAYEQSSVVEGQKWLTTPDERARGWHTELNGQITGLNEYFENSEGKLRFPRDPSGSAKNVIQCRCSTKPIIEGMTKWDGEEMEYKLWKTQDDAAEKWVEPMKEMYDKGFKKQWENLNKALDKL